MKIGIELIWLWIVFSAVEISGFASSVGFVYVPLSAERFWFKVKLKFIF
jgi:hypothetical protein